MALMVRWPVRLIPRLSLRAAGVEGAAVSRAGLSSLSRRVAHPESSSLLAREVVSCEVWVARSMTSFFSKLTGDELWRSVTGVSNAGRKRGRAVSRRRVRGKNLNLGQIIGVSTQRNMIWPGLNAPVIRGKEVVRQSEMPLNKEYVEKLHNIRDNQGKFKPFKLSPLERGWTSASIRGRKLGPPLPDPAYEGFETIVLEQRNLRRMSSVFGRQIRFSIFVVTGNKNGVAGFAIGKGPTMPAALASAKKKASVRLIHIDRFEGRTVHHNFWTQFGRSRLFVHKKAPGYGLKCHRALIACCEVLGIKDLHAKRASNMSKQTQNMVKAFFLGLMRQKTHQQLADETGLLVVQRKKEESGFPRIVARPQNEAALTPKILPDYNLYCMGGMVEVPVIDVPFWRKLPSYERSIRMKAPCKIRTPVMRRMFVESGAVQSRFTPVFPECVRVDRSVLKAQRIRDKWAKEKEGDVEED